ncbi:MAG TPA: hypothetical protein VN976_06480 [Verrucomicrobiae bacterium]|nr:hypothetical protein [Verrucomicrobiae bacterium]
MRRGLSNLMFAMVAALLLSNGLCAQTPAQQTIDRNAPVKAESAPAPAHDLTGVWMMRNPPGSQRGFTNYTFTKDPPELTPWAAAKLAEAKPSNGGEFTLKTTNDPVLTRCDPPGVPRVYFHPYPFEFVQTPKYILMLYEYDHTVRRFYTDGRPIPKDPDPLWLGTSVAHWDGNTTLVVDTVGFNDKTWLDRIGHPHSDQLHVVERFRRVNYDHMELDITMEDPKALAKPWTTTFYYQLRPNWELGEISCSGDYLDFSNFEK